MYYVRFYQGAGGDSIPSRVTPNTLKTGRFALFSLARGIIMRQATGWPAQSQSNGLTDSFLLTCGKIESVAWYPKTAGHGPFGPNKAGPN